MSARADSQRWQPHFLIATITGALRGHGYVSIETPQPTFQPGMAERAIDTATREAPLASLFIAFPFGIAVARRR
jgi:hypothetical protein